MPMYRIASPARSRVESRKPPNAVPPPRARARAPSTASSSEPTVRTAAPASSQPAATIVAATSVSSRPMTMIVFGVRRSASAARTTGARTARPASFTQAGRTESPRRRSCASGRLADIGHAFRRLGGDADSRRTAHEPLLGLVELLERGLAQAADHLPPGLVRLDQAGKAQDAQVPADERLGEPDAGGELAHRHRSDLRQQADHAEPRLV